MFDDIVIWITYLINQKFLIISSPPYSTGSMQVRVLIDFIKADQGQHKMLQQSIEQHELFASPTVIAVAHILVQKSQEGGGGSTKPQKTFESVAEKLVLDNEKYCESLSLVSHVNLMLCILAFPSHLLFINAALKNYP